MLINNKVFIATLIFYSVLVGCALDKRVSGEIPSTFLSGVDKKSKKENLPFDHAWVREGVDHKEYTAVYIKPIRVDLIPENEWKQSISPVMRSKAEFELIAKEVAQYLHDQLIEDIKAHKPKPLAIASSAAPHTLVFEIALTELELSHPIVRAAGMLAPVPGTGAAISTVSDPHVAFAARISDGATGQLLATIADRKYPLIRLIDVNKLTLASSAREVCALWADTITEALYSDGFTKISERSFSVLPW